MGPTINITDTAWGLVGYSRDAEYILYYGVRLVIATDYLIMEIK